MKAIFCVSGLALLIYCAAADSLLDLLGAGMFCILGIGLCLGVLVTSRRGNLYD